MYTGAKTRGMAKEILQLIYNDVVGKQFSHVNKILIPDPLNKLMWNGIGCRRNYKSQARITRVGCSLGQQRGQGWKQMFRTARSGHLLMCRQSIPTGQKGSHHSQWKVSQRGGDNYNTTAGWLWHLGWHQWHRYNSWSGGHQPQWVCRGQREGWVGKKGYDCQDCTGNRGMPQPTTIRAQAGMLG